MIIIDTQDSQEYSEETDDVSTDGNSDTRSPPLTSITFTWDLYLKLRPSRVAPRGAFRQPEVYPENRFTIGMKLRAKDYRRSHNWCLASVVGIEGLRLQLHFDDCDATEIFDELIDSENIRSLIAQPDPLLAPTSFEGDLELYPKFVDKVLRKKTTIIAPPECFPPTPDCPTRNLFRPGMKLEAVDRKNRDLICPATILSVYRDMVKIVFDGWRGPFDYTCEFYSRDLFPINWCRDVGHTIQPPNDWETIVSKETVPLQITPPSLNLIDDVPELSLDDSSAGGEGGNLQQVSEKTQSLGRERGQPRKLPSPRTRVSTVETSAHEVDEKFRSTPKKRGSKQDVSMGTSHDTVASGEGQSAGFAQFSPPERKTNKSTSTLTNELEEKVEDKPDYRQSLVADIIKGKSKNPSNWSIDDVLDLIRTKDTLVEYLNVFREHQIDGEAFMLITTDALVNYMGLKIGAVLKILDLREQVKRQTLM